MAQEQLNRREARKKILRAMLEAEINRHPIWPGSGEEGEFVAIIGWRTGAGVTRCPYYKTESGIYFALPKRQGDKDEPFRLDMEKTAGIGFYTPEAFINEEPPTWDPILESYHKDNST